MAKKKAAKPKPVKPAVKSDPAVKAAVEKRPIDAKERDRDNFPIWIRHGVSAVVFMILPSMILLNQNFAKSWRAKS